KSHKAAWKAANKKRAAIRFEEMELGTTYSQLRHLVVQTVTSSVTNTADRMSLAFASPGRHGTTGGATTATHLTAIREGEVSGETALEEGPPQWETPGWL